MSEEKTYAHIQRKAFQDNMKATVLDLRGKGRRDARREALPEDPFQFAYERHDVIAPPYDLDWLAILPEYNDTLVPVIDGFCSIVERTGWGLERAIPPGHSKAPDDVSDEELEEERAAAEELLGGLSVLGPDEMRTRSRIDKLLLGGRAFEVARGNSATPDGEEADPPALASAQPLNEAMGLPILMEPMPGTEMRITRVVKDADGRPAQARRVMWRRQRDGSWRKQYRWDHFRRYVQLQARNEVRWFKEFGDPREYDKFTGDIIPEHEVDAARTAGRVATEIIYDRYYWASRTPYGISPFIGNLLNITGTRKAAEVNWNLFENGLHIPLLLLIAGGQLTKDALEKLDELMEEHAGTDNWHKILTLEAAPFGATSSDALDEKARNPISMDVHPLKHLFENDALFQDYIKNGDDKVRRVLRMPPIFTGETRDQYTFATAVASLIVFEMTVARQARAETDRLINDHFFPEHGIQHWVVRSKPVEITDPDQMAKLIEAATTAGAVTPDEVRTILQKLIAVDLGPSEADWGETPIEVQKMASGSDGKAAEEKAMRSALAIFMRMVKDARTK